MQRDFNYEPNYSTIDNDDVPGLVLVLGNFVTYGGIFFESQNF